MTLVDRSPDLRQLVEEEYDIEIRDDNLLVHHVPYVTEVGAVAYCILVSELTTNAERAVKPGQHEVWVIGGIPYDHQGKKISIIADENRRDYGGELVACCRLSGKPGNQMPEDYHQKISNYVKVLSRYARAVDATSTYKGAPPRETSAGESVFCYGDAATSRAGISAVTTKLKLGKIAIVGLGGTGSYILDLVAKTPVAEIHLYDDDVLLAHNAFRAPGAAAFTELKDEPKKVDYYTQKYAAIRRGVVAHSNRISDSNIEELHDVDFVFLSIDAGPAKKAIIEKLVAWNRPFVDCGIGIQRSDNSLRGTARVTSASEARYDHIGHRVSFRDVNDDEYGENIQTADINMLNAALAVIKWKKFFGYYIDSGREFNSAYVIAPNRLVNGDVLE